MEPSKNRVFLLEGSLQGLARWLRFMGFRTFVVTGKITPELIQEHKDKFFLITSESTAKFLEKLGLDYILLPRESLRSQLSLLLLKLDLKPSLRLNLCSLCGSELLPVEKESFKERIPPKVWELCDEFNYCPKCDKLYWEGDHIRRMKERFKTLIGKLAPAF